MEDCTQCKIIQRETAGKRTKCVTCRNAANRAAGGTLPKLCSRCDRPRDGRKTTSYCLWCAAEYMRVRREAEPSRLAMRRISRGTLGEIRENERIYAQKHSTEVPIPDEAAQ